MIMDWKKQVASAPIGEEVNEINLMDDYLPTNDQDGK